MRLDKFLAQMGYGSRNDVKKDIKNGSVYINEDRAKSPKMHIDPEQDQIYFNQELVKYEPYVYIMLNKPQGVISATEDDVHQTVIDLIPKYQHLDLFPVGRLDKDTVGLLLITNDGQFNHQVMSPNKKIPKVYRVKARNPLTQDNQNYFQEGVVLSDGVCKPARLEILEDNKEGLVTIQEGKYHQVKRMFHEIENEVIFLERIAIGALKLDTELERGAYRKLTAEEIKLVLNI
ncbi:pseudouridine synthase [Staphylococcus canis]|uniref:Pseudouridine synthase n=1 Tax=Staphylococcus canis TaxID=2724942 RepID=A0ABS0T6H0_9STAP|nr:pseudouridine synthase [Staphylococcus canis]MBI5974277.1 rRNA pseudouridine synthase [Staphylococcus canis]